MDGVMVLGGGRGVSNTVRLRLFILRFGMGVWRGGYEVRERPLFLVISSSSLVPSLSIFAICIIPPTFQDLFFGAA